jgi:hydrogenase expression/formation protein HypC
MWATCGSAAFLRHFVRFAVPFSVTAETAENRQKWHGGCAVTIGGNFMCVALPGKVLSISENHAKVDFSGNIVDVHTGAVTAVPGDYVLVHAGCAIEVMSRETAEEILSIFAELA